MAPKIRISGETTRLRGGGDKAGDSADYDPYDHRDRENPTNDFETFVHIVKGALGTGILALPEGFKFAGMWNGIVSTIVIGILCTYCYQILAKSQYMLCKKRGVGLLTYPESMKVACEYGPSWMNNLARTAFVLTDAFLMIYQFGAGCVYVVFVAVNVKSVIDLHVPEKIHLLVYFAAMFIPFVLILSVRNLKLLAPFSTVANVITLVTFGVVGYYVCRNLEPFSKRPAFGKIMSYPLYFGTALFALQAVGVTVAAENNMKTPRSYRKPFGVLNVAMAIVTIIYVVVGMLGYWRYGEEIESTITLNFPKNEILAQVIKILYSIAIYISYGLQEFVGFDILWEGYVVKHFENSTSTRKLIYEYIVRFSIVVVTFLLAATIPLLGLFISLVGCLCLSSLGIAFPAIMEICAYWPDDFGPGKIRLWKDIVIIFIGTVGLISGMYSCILAIVERMQEGDIYN